MLADDRDVEASRGSRRARGRRGRRGCRAARAARASAGGCSRPAPRTSGARRPGRTRRRAPAAPITATTPYWITSSRNVIRRRVSEAAADCLYICRLCQWSASPVGQASRLSDARPALHDRLRALAPYRPSPLDEAGPVLDQRQRATPTKALAMPRAATAAYCGDGSRASKIACRPRKMPASTTVAMKNTTNRGTGRVTMNSRPDEADAETRRSSSTARRRRRCRRQSRPGPGRSTDPASRPGRRPEHEADVGDNHEAQVDPNRSAQQQRPERRLQHERRADGDGDPERPHWDASPPAAGGVSTTSTSSSVEKFTAGRTRMVR